MSVLAPDRPAVAPPPPAPPAEPDRDAGAPVRTGIVALLATAAAGWMAARLFGGALPPVAALLGAVVGAGGVALSFRSSRPALVQYLTLPVAVVLGAALALIDGGGDANLLDLVSRALRDGGLRRPPVPFDPGWRLVLVVLVALVGSASAALAVSLRRPKLAVAIPVPLVMAAALLQADDAGIASSAVAIALLLAALAVADAGTIAGEPGAAGSFERTRLLRGGGMLVALVVGIVVVSKASFLFPDTERSQVVPPERPSTPVTRPDRVLFRVDSPRPGPWRVGVLDVYDGLGWLLPPFDPSRIRPAGPGGSLAFTSSAPLGDGRPTEETVFEMAALDGHILPAVAGMVSIAGIEGTVEADPRTGVIRLPEQRAAEGLTYTIVSAVAPSGRDLAEAPALPAAMAPFLEAPAPPNEVVALLGEAPENAWDRLQFVRARFYEKVIAAGAGEPVDVPPGRVAAMLGGAEASPYEITAAEALLARWAGVPSRIGFGFYRGDRDDAGLAEVRPKHGATWLEVWFEGHGWVPVVGVPPRARSSLTPSNANDDPNVQPTDELAVVVHVPIRLQTVQLLYVAVRYWLAIVVPLLLGLGAAWWALPGALKAARRQRRRRWAARRGPRERIVVAYAELRDAATDAGAGDPAASPLAFLGALDRDDEHAELAWLVTRCLWGDLRRDVREEDAADAEEMARSLRRRLSAGAPVVSRLAAFGSRASLRDPYTTDVPNLWPAWARGRPVRSAMRSAMRTLRRRGRRRRAGAALPLLLAVALASSACAGDPAARRAAGREDLAPMPASLAGFEIKREPDAEAAYARAGEEALVAPDGRVYTVREGDTVQASLQVAYFKDRYSALDREVREGVLGSIGGGSFRAERLADERVYVQQLPEQRMLLWFSPEGTGMMLMVARRAFDGAGDAFLAAVRHAAGIEGDARPRVEPYDPRRGGAP